MALSREASNLFPQPVKVKSIAVGFPSLSTVIALQSLAQVSFVSHAIKSIFSVEEK